MINKEDFEDFVYIQALENAIQFKGKANGKALIGKCMPKFPDMKEEMSTWVAIIESITNQVNSLSLEKQKEQMLKNNPDFFEEKKEKKQPQKKDGLPNLGIPEPGSPDSQEVVVRFPPAPSGYLHLGHLFGIVANYELKKKYGGKFILRIEDTNPENIDLNNYDKVIEDVQWICDGEVDEIHYQSDRLEIYYKYMRTLFELGECYVCNCETDVFKSYTDAKEECPHRKMGEKEQKELFEKFMNGELERYVVRAKADITNKNPALRTFPIARINRNNHARVGNKYKVWPNYNLACAIDDSIMGITHVIRGKDLEIGEHRQKMIQKALGLKSPEYFHYGRMKFEDMELSKSRLTEKIEKGEFEGWLDPRVPSIASFRKRGYKALAFREFIKQLGISKRDSRITSDEYYKGLDFHNKQILEKEAKRFFFVHNPKKLHIKNINDYPEKELLLAKHPEDKSYGFRHIPVKANYYIDSLDFEAFEKGDLIRLMHFGNFKIEEKNDDELNVRFISKEYNKELDIKRNIHYILQENNQKVIITLQNNSKLKGIMEEHVTLKPQESIQFERFGFVTFNKEEDDVKLFSFTHR